MHYDCFLEVILPGCIVLNPGSAWNTAFACGFLLKWNMCTLQFSHIKEQNILPHFLFLQMPFMNGGPTDLKTHQQEVHQMNFQQTDLSFKDIIQNLFCYCFSPVTFDNKEHILTCSLNFEVFQKTKPASTMHL